MKQENTNEELFLEEKKFDFKSLTPRKDVDLSAYEEAFEFALKNMEIKNVAVTGSYGAGKSSVMETFKKTEFGEKYTYLHISLAHFEKLNAEETVPQTEEQIEHQLEGKIINQLIHKIPLEKIPYTRVALRKNIEEESVLKWTTGIVVGIIVTLYLVLYSSMLNIDTDVYFIQNFMIKIAVLYLVFYCDKRYEITETIKGNDS